MIETATRPGLDDLVEHMGGYFKALGLPRATGQIFGYLLACDPAEQSDQDISRDTGLSAASVSSATSLLAQINAIEQRHRVGDRKAYYRLRPDFWIAMARSKLQGFGELAVLGREVKAGGELTRTDGIDEMIAFSDFWQELVPEFEERWEQRRKAQAEQA